MRTFDPYSPEFDSDNQKFVHDIMASFLCSKEIAQKIIKSSELNGQLESIKNVCHSNNAEKRGKQ